MSTFWIIFYILLGFVLGRLYARMKYHMPEYVEASKLAEAKLRAERMKHEARAEGFRSDIDDEIERRVK